MPPWKRVAREMLPELAEAVTDAETPYLLWFELRGAFEDAYEASPRDASLIRRIYAFSDWCVRAPRGETAADDLPTCVAVCFLEHIPEHPAARGDMPAWFTLEELLASRGIFGYHIGDQAFDELAAYFRSNPALSARYPTGGAPDA